LDDDLRLSGGSPAIDAGDNAAVLPDYGDLDDDGNFDEVTPLDLVGLSRFFDALLSPDIGNGTPPLVDIGAIEAFEYGISLPIILRQNSGP
jgi:hypothetical protein